MLKKVLLVLLVVVVGGFALVVSRPSTTRVEGARTIAAPAVIVFGLVNDFHRWKFWAPWEALDPNLKRGFDGPFAGPDAVYTWSGNTDAGKGRLTLLEAQPYERILIRAERSRPRASTRTFLFTFQPVPEGVTLHWAQERQLSFLDKARALFTDPDEGVAGELARGLETLQSVSEEEVRNRLERDALIRERRRTSPAAPPTP